MAESKQGSPLLLFPSLTPQHTERNLKSWSQREEGRLD